MIPRIIHQTWKTAELPKRFREMQASWRQLNPGWEYRFWTDEALEQMVAQHFPNLLSLYRRYSTGVQRADAARYMLLHQFGGLYADIDTTCLASFEPLVNECRAVFSHEPTEHHFRHCSSRGLNHLLFNGTMASPAAHPFWELVLGTLPVMRNARNTLDMTGPLLLTGCADKYHHPEQLAINSCHLFNPQTSRSEPSRDPVFGPHGALRLSVHHWAGTWYTTAARTRRHEVKKALREIRYRLTRGKQFSFADAKHAIDHELLAEPLPAALAPRSQRISCLIPVRDAEPHLDRCFDLLLKLDHPGENIRVTFCEGDSQDGTREKLYSLADKHRREFRDLQIVHFDVGTQFPYEKRWLPNLQRTRRQGLARVRNRLIDVGLSRDDDWALWLDADLADYSSDVLQQLLEQRQKIIVPNCVLEPGGKSFDMNSFLSLVDSRDYDYYKYVKHGLFQPRSNTHRRLHLHDVRYLPQVPLNGVGGTMMLVHASVHRAGVRFPEEPYNDLIETEGFGQLARDLGVTPVGLPNLEIIHPRC